MGRKGFWNRKLRTSHQQQIAEAPKATNKDRGEFGEEGLIEVVRASIEPAAKEDPRPVSTFSE
jgi:hypothetical protein